MEPDATRVIIHNGIVNDVLIIDVRVFCSDVVEAAEAWLQQAERSPRFLANYERFMRRYPQGLDPYVTGVPVIA